MGNKEVKIKYVFICPPDIQRNISANVDYLCKNMLDSVAASKNCLIQGGVQTTKMPEKNVPVVRYAVYVVVVLVFMIGCLYWCLSFARIIL